MENKNTPQTGLVQEIFTALNFERNTPSVVAILNACLSHVASVPEFRTPDFCEKMAQYVLKDYAETKPQEIAKDCVLASVEAGAPVKDLVSLIYSELSNGSGYKNFLYKGASSIRASHKTIWGCSALMKGLAHKTEAVHDAFRQLSKDLITRITDPTGNGNEEPAYYTLDITRNYMILANAVDTLAACSPEGKEAQNSWKFLWRTHELAQTNEKVYRHIGHQFDRAMSLGRELFFPKVPADDKVRIFEACSHESHSVIEMGIGEQVKEDVRRDIVKKELDGLMSKIMDFSYHAQQLIEDTAGKFITLACKQKEADDIGMIETVDFLGRLALVSKNHLPVVCFFLDTLTKRTNFLDEPHPVLIKHFDSLAETASKRLDLLAQHNLKPAEPTLADYLVNKIKSAAQPN